MQFSKVKHLFTKTRKPIDHELYAANDHVPGHWRGSGAMDCSLVSIAIRPVNI